MEDNENKVDEDIDKKNRALLVSSLLRHKVQPVT